MVKNLPARQELQETCIESLDQEDLLGKVMATHSSDLAWRILWTGVWWSIVHRVSESDMTE